MIVSIITPVFNSELFLAATIESVLRQTYSDWELILIDGGSCDKSNEICQEYVKKDIRIKLLNNQNDCGPAHARCTGIKAAKGDYIAFLDADDLWDEDKLLIQLKEMREKNISFSYTRCRELQPNGKTVSRILPTKISFSYPSYLGQRGIYALTVIIKKDLLSEDIISIWNKDSYDDTLWWLLVMKKGVKAFLIDKDLALYRLSPNQLSANRIYTIKRVYSLFNFFPEIGFWRKNYYFISYLVDSGIRQFLLKYTRKHTI